VSMSNCECDELVAENASLREELRYAHECIKRIQRPEPYRIGAVFGLKGNVKYALQIVHVYSEYPVMTIEVMLP
jgi:hypothetical protein